MASIIPIVIIGAAAYYFGKKKRKKKKKNGNGQKSLTEARGTIFPAGEVDVIEANVGERFTVAIPEVAGVAYVWDLAASPPGETIKLVREEVERDAKYAGMGGGPQDRLFIFDAQKPGSGALVFHYLRPFEKGKVPPEKVLEIQTKVS